MRKQKRSADPSNKRKIIAVKSNNEYQYVTLPKEISAYNLIRPECLIQANAIRIAKSKKISKNTYKRAW